MVVTNDIELPTFEDLTVDELNLSTSTLISAGPYVGKYCEAVNNEFMLCRMELNDPRPCMELGKRVTACAFEIFRKIKKECSQEFNQYNNCIDKSSGDFAYRYCRNTQAVFDQCMAENVHMERPEYGYFCRPRIHKSQSKEPLGPPCPCPKMPDPTPALPECAPRKPARFTSRFFWVNE